MSSTRIPLSEPCISGNARAYLDECLRTNFVSSVGPFVERFERDIAGYAGSSHAVACASGTAAIHVALRLLDVGPGDEVFVPSFTFIASANPVVYQGATPVLVDSEPRTWNLDPDLITEEIEARSKRGARLPKAIVAVHILGHPADLEPLVRTCDRHGIALVEDAAEALGATFQAGALSGRHVGRVGRIGCFSFNGNKIITTGGGGMIVTDDAKLAARAKHLTTQARIPGRAYDHDDVGYNYRLTNIAAALGVAQLEELPGFLEKKRRIAERYDDAFRNHPAIDATPKVPWASPSYWLYSVTLAASVDRERVLDHLASRGIEARPLWTPLHRMAPFKAAPRVGDGRVAESIAFRGLSLPSSVSLSEADQERVIATMLEATGLASSG